MKLISNSLLIPRMVYKIQTIIFTADTVGDQFTIRHFEKKASLFKKGAQGAKDASEIFLISSKWIKTSRDTMKPRHFLGTVVFASTKGSPLPLR